MYSFDRFGHRCGYRLAMQTLLRYETGTKHLEIGKFSVKSQPIRADRKNGIAHFITGMKALRLAGEKESSRMGDGGSSVLEGEHQGGIADG